MNQKLITLNGNSGPIRKDIRSLGDLEAGLIFWKGVTEMDPSITWGEVLAGTHPALCGFPNPFKNLGRKLKNAINDTGSVIKNVGDTVGSWVGSSVRLATDEKVLDGVSRATTAYASGGSSEALRTVTDMFGSSTKNPITQAGKEYKTQLASFPTIGGIDARWIMGGAAALILVVLLTQKR
jgi:hypothetical protein